MIAPEIKIFHSLEEIPQVAWENLESAEFPFSNYAFLSALESNNCLGARTGWNPVYLTAWHQDRMMGAFVCYVKNNSYGEYIFDFQWAQAFQMQKIAYYPKLTSAAPFTPATGPKLLGDPFTFPFLINAAQAWALQVGASSIHALFITEAEIPAFADLGFFVRHSFQYHWQNQSYRDFSDFLSQLRSKRRKEILRERGQATSSGIQIRRLTGSDLTADHARAMHGFYLDTVQKMGGFDYLTKEFFQQVFAKMKDKILLVIAETPDGKMVAGALNYFGNSTLFGRHWGCVEDYKSLHFELCYYQGIEFAIERKMKLFEAGAQGEHKFQRGFLPCLTYSAHQIKEPRLDNAIRNFTEMEKLQLAQLFTEYQKSTPFSREL